MMNEEIVQNTLMESESIVEDNSVNELEKSFTQEAMETTHEENREKILMRRFLMILKNLEWILMHQIYSVQKPKAQVQMNFYLLTKRKRKMILRYQHS